MRPKRCRWSTRRRWSSAAALSATASLGILLSGCGDSPAPPAPDRDEEVLLQPAVGQGPDPYTATTVRELYVPAPAPLALPAPESGQATRGQTLRTVSGATPGLYGGTRFAGSCDVERQLTLLRADPAKVRAFAAGAGIDRERVPGFLRELTPVVLRTDTRVTSHGFKGGSAVARHAVLQAGTAVLVDRHGAPRVRCAGGNPLTSPVAVKGAVIHKGRLWKGYRPDRIVVVKSTPRAMGRLVIVDVAHDTWVDRRTGTDGEQDKRPEVLPPVVPDDIYAYPPSQTPADPPDQESDTGTESPSPSGDPDETPADPGRQSDEGTDRDAPGNETDPDVPSREDAERDAPSGDETDSGRRSGEETDPDDADPLLPEKRSTGPDDHED
ncbi:DUF6777 domain-containing protein [Streptomyces sp. NPDC004726]